MPSSKAHPSLLDDARSGDARAFDSLARECRAPLERHVQARIGRSLSDRVESDDVLQETYERAWKSIGQFRGEDLPAFLSWLGTISERVILDLARRLHRRDVIFVGEPRDPSHHGPSPSAALRREERFSRLLEALDSLSPDHREVVMLVRLEGLKIHEAAQRMGRTPNAVMKLLTRALTKLKAAFGDTESLHLPPRRLGSERGSDDEDRQADGTRGP